jgi:hypothetical protein
MTDAPFKDHHFSVATGDLTLRLPARIKPEDYVQIEARRNPKRGFLFVSPLLGKHLPVGLGKMRKVHHRLMARLRPQLPSQPGDMLVIGMAETATALGYGLWRNLDQFLMSECPPHQAYFLQSTRYRLPTPAWSFEEGHSHAPSQWIHGLDDPRLAQVRHVVLVDDELSTGRTFEALESVLRAQLPHLAQVFWVCLTDFRAPDLRAARPAAALLEGEWTWTWTHRPDAGPLAEGGAVDPALLQADFGRAVPLDRTAHRMAVHRAEAWLTGLKGHAKGRVLMLGTGEFMPLPLALAETIEGWPEVDEVDFQATTRSPALMPVTRLGLDHYGEGVAQYLYNYERAAYDTVVVAVETPSSTATLALGQALQATVIGPAP